MSPTTASKSIFSRIISYITSWFMYIFESIYSLYKDELERQSRDETDYKKWKLYEETERNQQTQQYDEESILGITNTIPSPSTSTVSIQELKLSSEEEISPFDKLCETNNDASAPQQISVTSEQDNVAATNTKTQEEPPVVVIKTNVDDITVVVQPPVNEQQKPELDNKPVIQPAILPIVEETKKETVIQPPKPAIKEPSQQPKKTHSATNANQSNNVTSEKQSKPAEISGLIGERLKLKKFRNISGNAYNSLIKPSANKEASVTINKEPIMVTPPVSSTQEVIQQSNTQLIQRKLSSKPKRVSRRPSQQTIKHSDVLSKLEEEATIELPDVEKFRELEEFSQLEKKVGLENALKQMKQSTTPPPPPLSQVVNVNNTNSTSDGDSKSSTTKSNTVTLGAILSAKNSLRKTTEEWK